jgi:hypothetical protein
MDEFTDFDEISGLASIAVLLLMATWGCAIVAIDHWVLAGRSDLQQGGSGGHGIAPRDDKT